MNLKYLIVFILVFGLIPSANASTCTVKDTGCIVGVEQCLFSMFSQTNSHVAKCGSPFYTLDVCCTSDSDFNTDNCYLNTTGNGNCNIGEGEIISMYNITNSHAELYGQNNYNNTVCCDAPVTWDSYDCHFNTSSTCELGETAVITMYNYTNSHVGNLSIYDNILCCNKEDNTPPSAIVTYMPIVPSSSITFNVNCADLGGSGCDYVNISSYDSVSGIYNNSCVANGFMAGMSSCAISLSTCEYNTYDINVSVWDSYGNNNDTINYGSFQVKKADGCACLTDDDCAESCVDNICSSSGNEPFVYFNRATTATTVKLSTIETIYVNVKNPTYATKSVPLYLGSFDNIKNWVWFDGHKYDSGRRNISIQLGPKEER
ncbi:hypothetical protein GQ473_06190, partial [archaeon]|nr:hypothetical protein [archaeon]